MLFPKLNPCFIRVSSVAKQSRLLIVCIGLIACWWSAGPSFVWAQEGPSQEDAAAPAAEETPQTPTFGFLDHLELGRVFTDNSWQYWVLLGVAIFFGLLVGKIVAVMLRRSAERFRVRGWAVWGDVLKDLASPAKLALLTVGLQVGLMSINLTQKSLLDGLRDKVPLLLYSIAAFWYAFNLVSVIDLILCRFAAKTESDLDDQLAPLIRKTLRVVVVIIGVMFVVDSVFGQDIGALLAGLGIAGLAVSLAAQDSLKNLFGSITILLDRPFHVGERITCSGFDGIIEEIGFRSTKMRTLTGHLVTIPNSNIVSDPVENIGRRPSIRRTMNVTITYDTPREKIEQAVQILRDLLEEEGLREPIHATINGNEYPPRVYFNDYNADSLNIMVLYWFAPPAYWDYVDHAQRFNLRLFEEFEKAGIEFAFPTQTLYLAGDSKRQLSLKMLGTDL